MTRRGIKQHLLFVALAPAVAVALGLTLYSLVLRFSDADGALAERGAVLARQLMGAAAQELRESDGAALQHLVDTAIQEEGVSGIVIADAAGRVLVSAGSARGTTGAVPPHADGWSGPTRGGHALLFHAQNAAAGVTVEMPTAAVEEHKRRILVVTLLAAFAALTAGGLLARRLVRNLAGAVLGLEDAIARIRGGHYAVRAPAHPDRALYDIESGVNDLAAALEAAQRKVTQSQAEREAELARQLNFAQAMLDAQASSGIGLAVIEHGRIVFANPAVERMSGYSLEELQALPHFVEIAHEDDRGLIMRNYLQHQAGEESEDRYDFTLQRKDGSVRQVQLAQSPIVAGNHLQLLGIIVDITERKQAEAQLAETHRQLLARKEEAERTSLAKSRFLAAASHDLRQPLHALMLFAAELETAAATPDQKRLAGQIAAATGAMGELLDALLEMSRLDTGNITPQRLPFALGPLLGEIVDAHRRSAAAKGLRLVCVGTAAWVDSDPHLLRRLVGNLVANAVRYTHHGGIVVGVRREDGGHLRIEVRDSGIGIDNEHLPHIFQEFYQVGNLERDTGKGLGLGLAIVDRLARMLGHRLSVRSMPRRGSVFAVSVPRTAPTELPAAPRPEPPSYAARILVASEAPPELESLGNLLENWGYRVLRAGDERQLRVHMAVMPDLVVCDERFVDGLGRSLAGRPRPRPQVVLVGDLPDGPLPSGLFFDGRLAKPVKPGRLRALLHHLLEEAAEQQGKAAA